MEGLGRGATGACGWRTMKRSRCDQSRGRTQSYFSSNKETYKSS